MQRWRVRVVEVEVVVVVLLEDELVVVVVDVVVLVLEEVDVDVDVLVDVEVVLVVVSHPLQVLSHCATIGVDVEHSPASKIRSHVARGNKLTLLAHIADVDTRVGVDVEVLILFALLEEADAAVVVAVITTMFEHLFVVGHKSSSC